MTKKRQHRWFRVWPARPFLAVGWFFHDIGERIGGEDVYYDLEEVFPDKKTR